MQQSHQCQGTVNHEYPANLYAKIESLKYCLISWRTTERSSILKDKIWNFTLDSLFTKRRYTLFENQFSGLAMLSSDTEVCCAINFIVIHCTKSTEKQKQIFLRHHHRWLEHSKDIVKGNKEKCFALSLFIENLVRAFRGMRMKDVLLTQIMSLER